MKKFECKFCKKKFRLKSSLEQHLQAKHFKKEKIEIRKEFSKKKVLIYSIFTFFGILIFYALFWALTSPLKIGPLGSAFIHADFAVFINGEKYDFNQTIFFEKNPYIYISYPYSSLLRIRATNVPLKMFFDSIGWRITKDCIKLHTSEEYCTNKTHSLKFYVNGKRIEDISNYLIKDLDKILISYGNESEEQIKFQLKQISDFAWQASYGLLR